MLWASTTESDYVILRAAQEVFRGQPYQLIDLARAEMDGLLSAVLILDDKLQAVDQEERPTNEEPLRSMDRWTRRSIIDGLMSSYIEWAAIAAETDTELIDKVVGLIDALPEGRDRLRGTALRVVEHLVATVEGTKRILPHLYYGLVGSSALVRSHAASALGEVRYRSHKNIPPLVYEVFCALLWDPYVIVHKAAVSALRRFSLPEVYRPRAADAVLNLLHTYRGRSDEADFLVECVNQLASWTNLFGSKADSVRDTLIDVLLEVDPVNLGREVRFLSHSLGQCDAFANVVIRMLPHVDRYSSREDESRQLLQRLSDSAVVSRQEEFVAVGTKLLAEVPWISFQIVERLSAAGAASAARQLADASVSQVPDTTRNQFRRVRGRFISIATAFEEAIAAADGSALDRLAKAWAATSAESERQKAEGRERDNRTSLSFEDRRNQDVAPSARGQRPR